MNAAAVAHSRAIPQTMSSEDTRSRLVQQIIAVVAVFSSIYLQRVAVPGTVVGIGSLIPYIALAYLGSTGRLTLKPMRLAFGLLLLAVLALASVASTAYSPEPISGGSLGLVVLMWFPFIFVTLSPKDVSIAALKIFQFAMVPIAILTVLQFVLQSAFPIWLDPISIMPKNWLLSGYQAAYEFRYGTGQLKANGVFFLESSFASQYLALAALASLSSRRFLSPLFIIALITTGGGTGIVMLVIGLAVYAARGSLKVRSLVVVTVGVGWTVMNWLGLSDQILGRAGEIGGQNTSGSLRFVEPYEAVMAAFTKVESSVFWGLGPGSADSFAVSIGIRGNFSLVPKLLIEYGILPTILFVTFVTVMILRLNVDLAVKLPMLTMIVVLSGALIQAHTSLLVWAFAVCAQALPPGASLDHHARPLIPANATITRD